MLDPSEDIPVSSPVSDDAAPGMRPEFVAYTFRAYLLIAGLTAFIILVLSVPRSTQISRHVNWIIAFVTVVYVFLQAWLYRACGARTSADPERWEEWLRRMAFWVLMRDSLFLCALCWSAGTYKSIFSVFVLVPVLIGILLLDRVRIRLLATFTAGALTALVLLETFNLIPHVEWSLEFLDVRANPWNALPVIATFVCSIFVVYSVALAVLDELAAKRNELEAMANRDMLTGLYNRRVFEISAARELERAVRTGGAVTFALVDVDHFKSVNDTHGHGAGDQVLKAVSRVFDQSLRRGVDMAFRFGGDEFVLLLTDTEAKGASVILNRILEKIRAERFEEGTGTFGITLSLGAFTIYSSDMLAELDYCLEMADQCLYRAKRSGRNCVVVEDSQRSA